MAIIGPLRACPAPAPSSATELAIDRHPTAYLQAAPAAAMWTLARLLPCRPASRLGAALLGALGPRLRKHRHILRNLRQVLPDADDAALERTARSVWRNLGAVLFEFPHLPRISARGCEVTLSPAVRELFEHGRPMLFMTAHLANWELLASYVARQGTGLAVVYSPQRNPVLERMIQRLRTPSGCWYVTKQDALRSLTPERLEGRSVGLLPDVRVDSAPLLPLFGVAAPTTISPARLALRLGYPVVPARAKRLGPGRFELEFSEPLTPSVGGVGKAAALDLTAQFNRLLEAWIRERPGEWLATKRRWPKPQRATGPC